MARAALFVISLLALAVSGFAFVKNGGELGKGGSISLLSGHNAAYAELTAASTSMLEAKTLTGTFSAVDLRNFHNLAIVRADESSYCLQVGVGKDASHLAGPGGTPTDGPC